MLLKLFQQQKISLDLRSASLKTLSDENFARSSYSWEPNHKETVGFYFEFNKKFSSEKTKLKSLGMVMWVQTFL